MKVSQTIRSLGRACARLGVLAAVCALGAVPAMAQGRGPGGPGGPGRPGGVPPGMHVHSFMAPPPPALTPHLGLQLGLGGRWWDDGKTMKKLNLRADQQRRMDDIFEANKPELINLFGNLQREEAHLNSLPPGDLQDETKVFAAIDRVAQARAELEKANVHLLLQIRQQLDPDQVARLDREIANSR